MFDADRPILTSQEDRLGRTMFAAYLARSILDHLDPHSFVIGLYGAWGSGKTSLLNLALEELHLAASNMAEDEKPVLLNFSAWSYSGQQQLIYSFFRRLSSELRRTESLENAAHIIHLMELYVSFFTHQPVPKALRPKHNWFDKLFKKNIIHDETFGWESGHDLTQVKAELNRLLGLQKRKLIIMIDNISRLAPEEISQMFQIVKSIGNFSNTVYVLALDKTEVLKTINKDYLDKIVQLPFDVPAISSQDIETLFLDRLKNAIVIVPEESWSTQYWADIYYSTLKFFFHTVRDITCYVNTLSFSYPRVKDIVNPVDFFAITALLVFMPKVYMGIRDNKDLFTDLMDGVYRMDDTKRAEDKRRCDEIFQRGDKIPRELLIQLLIRLFPRLRMIYESTIPFYHSESIARKNKRICSPDIFDVYFRMSMPTGVIPESEFNAILSFLDDEEGFALALLRLNQDEKITRFLDLLDSAGVNKIPIDQESSVIQALMDSADLFPMGENSLVGFNTPMRVHRIFHQLLSRSGSPEKRFLLYQNAIKKAVNSIYIIVHELTVQSDEHNETEDTFLPLEERDFLPEQLVILKKLAVGKIKYWAEIGRLAEHPQLLAILSAWKSWGNEMECQQYVAGITQDDRGLLAFLQAALKEPIDEAILKQEKSHRWESALFNIEEFISPDSIIPHAKLLFEDLNFENLREREQLALLIFLDLVHADTVKIIPKTI